MFYRPLQLLRLIPKTCRLRAALHSTCDTLLMAMSLVHIDDGRLSKLSKFSAHVFKIAPSSVRSVFQSAQRSGVVPQRFGP